MYKAYNAKRTASIPLPIPHKSNINSYLLKKTTFAYNAKCGSNTFAPYGTLICSQAWSSNVRVSGPPCNHSDSRVKRPAVDLRDMKSALGSGTNCLYSGYPDLNFF